MDLFYLIKIIKWLLYNYYKNFVNYKKIVKNFSARAQTDLKQQAKENLDSNKGKALRKISGTEIESVFGDGKLNKNKDRYLLRGLSKINIEAGLYYTSHNLRKI